MKACERSTIPSSFGDLDVEARFDTNRDANLPFATDAVFEVAVTLPSGEVLTVDLTDFAKQFARNFK